MSKKLKTGEAKSNFTTKNNLRHHEKENCWCGAWKVYQNPHNPKDQIWLHPSKPRTKKD